MLLRDAPDGVVAIGQPAHAWLAGQLARAWGNDRFGSVEPREEVCLAATQHDIGMAAWDAAPELDPATGRPYGFLDLPTATHLRMWTDGPRLVAVQSRYAALLVSLHGASLYERRADAGEGRVADYLAAQRAFQAELLASLRAEPRLAPHAGAETVERNRRLLAGWDRLSLALCLDRLDAWQIAVPAAAGEQRLALRRRPDGAIEVASWPFAAERVTVACEGRRLAGTYASEAAMREALAGAPWQTLTFELRPPVADAPAPASPAAGG